jgi:hypothetical protein
VCLIGDEPAFPWTLLLFSALAQKHLILGNQNCKSRFRKMNELQAIAFGGFWAARVTRATA